MSDVAGLRLGLSKRNILESLRSLHRTIALGAGLLILVVTITGALTLFRYELERAYYGTLFQASGPTNVSADTALKAVADAYPERKRTTVILVPGGNWEVWTEGPQDEARYVYVDGGNGQILGERDPNASPFETLSRFHTTLFSTEAVTIPGLGWSLGNLLHGLTVLALLFMSVSGLVMWWPGLKKLARVAFRIQGAKASLARSLSWHRLAGIIALPFLLMWSVTAIKQIWPNDVRPLYDTVMPGGALDPYPKISSAPATGEPLGVTKALALAETAIGGMATAVILPSDPQAVYDVFAQDGVDPYARSNWRGNAELWIDQYSGQILFDSRQRYQGHMPQYVYDNWLYNIHNGRFLPWPLRLLWLAAGLLPLALAITGLRMFLMRRKLRR